MFNNKFELIELVIVLVGGAIWLLRLLHRSYVKPLDAGRDSAASPAPLEGRKRPQGAPKNLSEFLEEIRGEMVRRAAPRESDETLDEAEEVPPPAALPPPVLPPPVRRSPQRAPTPVERKKIADELSRRIARRVEEEPRRYPLEPLEVPSARVEELEREPVRSAAPGSVHTYLDNLARKEAGALAQSELARKRASGSHGKGTWTLPGTSLSARDAFLAQVILGPPRCRERRRNRA